MGIDLPPSADKIGGKLEHKQKNGKHNLKISPEAEFTLLKMNSRDVLEVPHNFEFPFTPYNIQHEFMSKLYEVIENKQLGVFESPTGTVTWHSK